MKFYTVEKIARQLPELKAAGIRAVQPLRPLKYHAGEAPDGAAPALDDSGWQEFPLGGQWGGQDQIAWFRTSVSVPEAWRGGKVQLRFVPGPADGGESTAEAMLYVDGAPLQGLDVWHETVWLPPELKERPTLSLAVRAWSGSWHPPARRTFQVAQLELVDEATEAFYHLANTLHQTLGVLSPNDLRRELLLNALQAAFLKLDFTERRSAAFYASVSEAHAYLAACVQAWQAQSEIKPRVTAIGHAHIDLAWLWRWTSTRDKAQRTFATVLHLMRQYPEYRFMHSSPHLYQAVREDAPELYARIRERIAAGDWEITGGMWVESDTNVPNGESLVRQFLFGKRFIREEFGRETTILWLPDVFGYSAALPQIIKGSGVQYFLTTKISWSQINRFPHDTFNWRGLDGTEVLTHFVTTPDSHERFYTYNGHMQPYDVAGLWDSYRQKDVNDELLHLFGWGDGGGGPTMEMLETARALANLPGMPAVAQGPSEGYFARLAERVAGAQLPTWDGELYLEFHRGTYTSQAFNKRANRQAEILYHTAEWLAALAALTTGAPYPHAGLRAGWEKLLFNQFHDILPGSSIPPVYVDSRADYAEIARVGAGVVEAARAALTAQLAAPVFSVAVFNPLGWARGGVISLPAEALAGKSLGGAVQAITAADGSAEALAEVTDVPALGYKVAPLQDGGATTNSLSVTAERLENDYYTVSVNAQGQITSLFDKRADREVLALGARANVLQTFEDKPMQFDAWDIDLYYQEKCREVTDLVEVVVEETGPVRGTLRLVWRFHTSTITQRLSLYAHTPRIDFRTEVDWHARQTLLKVAFPVNIRATRATYDIQFGSVERPTHWNTSWDWARFETIGHKWVDLSEGNYGVALLNDCKYGHDIKDNVLRLTLLRSAIDPDPLADEGRHSFTYSLLPHAGDWRVGGVVREAYALNVPLSAVALAPQPQGALPSTFSLAATDADHVIIETVKEAEAGQALVFRVYECHQMRRTGARLKFARTIRNAVECNLVEEDERPVSFSGSALTFPIRPFEIKTFKVWFETP
ncbi:MAG: alpha-mannosidase [Anaerolineales bacterium]|nr:alpha-mannosidase [Anaerolineales bacterium]